MTDLTSSSDSIIGWLRERRGHDHRPLESLLADRQLETIELLNVISVDLIECQRRGFPRSVEAYLTAFPEIGSNPEWILDLIDAELCMRREKGERIHDEEYPRRFPALKDRFQKLFELERMEADFANLAVRHQPLGDESTKAFVTSFDANSLIVSPADPRHPGQLSQLETFSAGGPWLTPPDGIRLTQLFASRPGVQMFRGIRQVDRRPMAVKVIRTSVADALPIQAFMDRLELFAKLKSDYCETADSVEVNGHHFVITRRWIEAVDWSVWVACQTDLRRVLNAVAMIADVLQMCHHAELPHGHLHPGNLLVDHSGRIKIVDFGMSAKHSLVESWYPIGSRQDVFNPVVAKTRDTFGVTTLALNAIERSEPTDRPLRKIKELLLRIQGQPQLTAPRVVVDALRCHLSGQKFDIPEPLRKKDSRVLRWLPFFRSDRSTGY